MISIIIPTLNEEAHIVHCLQSIYSQNEEYEVICVDGGSTDKTQEILINEKRVIAIKSEKGRANQMNAGAKKAEGDVLLFLHADSMLPAEALTAIKEKVSKGYVGGGFFQQFGDTRRSLRFVSFRSNFRAQHFKIFFGDQGIFVKKDVFFEMKGFKSLPIMEDLEFCKRLKKKGKVCVVRKKIVVSARNYLHHGVFRLTWIYFRLMIMYHFGASFEKIKKRYDSFLL